MRHDHFGKKKPEIATIAPPSQPPADLGHATFPSFNLSAANQHVVEMYDFALILNENFIVYKEK